MKMKAPTPDDRLDTGLLATKTGGKTLLLLLLLLTFFEELSMLVTSEGTTTDKGRGAVSSCWAGLNSSELWTWDTPRTPHQAETGTCGPAGTPRTL